MAGTPCEVTHEAHSTDVIDLAPFLEVLRSLDRNDSGATSTELKERMNVGEARMKKMLGESVRQGLIVPGKRLDRKHWSGVPRTFTVYRLKED